MTHDMLRTAKRAGIRKEEARRERRTSSRPCRVLKQNSFLAIPVRRVMRVLGEEMRKKVPGLPWSITRTFSHSHSRDKILVRVLL